ncbi:MAG: hypothetical protein WCT35_01525 [Sideroxydans sp.]|jgi:hypothetical protein
MKNIDRNTLIVSLAFCVFSGIASAQDASSSATDDGVKFAYGGDAYLALQNWSKVGMADDSKMGFGFGGSIGVGMQVDDMKILIGPQLAFSRWSADYSNKPNSATDSVYIEMADAGLQFTAIFDDIVMAVGKGNSTISSGYIVNGRDIRYNYDGKSYPYSTVSIGFKMDMFMFSVGVVNYEGYVQDASRTDFRLGVAF